MQLNRGFPALPYNYKAKNDFQSLLDFQSLPALPDSLTYCTKEDGGPIWTYVSHGTFSVPVQVFKMQIHCNVAFNNVCGINSSKPLQLSGWKSIVQLQLYILGFNAVIFLSSCFEYRNKSLPIPFSSSIIKIFPDKP